MKPSVAHRLLSAPPVAPPSQWRPQIPAWWIPRSPAAWYQRTWTQAPHTARVRFMRSVAPPRPVKEGAGVNVRLDAPMPEKYPDEALYSDDQIRAAVAASSVLRRAKQPIPADMRAVLRVYDRRRRRGMIQDHRRPLRRVMSWAAIEEELRTGLTIHEVAASAGVTVESWITRAGRKGDRDRVAWLRRLRDEAGGRAAA